MKQAPAFNLSMLTDNRWTRDYGEYVREQFILRDGWLKMHSFFEQGLQKIELGDVWCARDGYLIAKTNPDAPDARRVAQANAQAICSLGERFPGRVHVMLVPSASNIMAGHLRFDPPRMDENALMDEVNAKLRESGISIIDLRGGFRGLAESGSQVYYRTDHHWTTDGGAFLAYEAFCNAVGLDAVLPPDGLKSSAGSFLGTNYAKSLFIGATADQLVYYDFPNKMAIEKYSPDGSAYMQEEPLMAYDKLASRDKYGAFLHGNNGYTHIEGDGRGRVVIVKDSYGNSFVPFLTANYKDIEVIDLRGRRSIGDILDSDSDILVLYSFTMFTQDTELVWLSVD
ncbi:MAG: hypothetical protein LBH28_10305 [Oscillospiraceae bacterium]|nr:hypothetical protein [Oscillospiraceae bacterium]